MKPESFKDKQGCSEEEFFQKYDAGSYERPSVTVDMLVFTVMDEMEDNYRKLPQKSLNLLMIKRGKHPFLGQWALPGGFVAIHESVEAAALRELKTETNIDNIYMEQLYTWGDVDRDPRTRVISCSYMALVDSAKMDIKAGEDADDARWFKVRNQALQEKKIFVDKGFISEKWEELQLSNHEGTLTATIKVTDTLEGRVGSTKREIVNSNGIAFDHAKMIHYALERLKNKIEYTDIAFNLMPEFFALSELQQVYEVILGKELLAAAFRRKIADMVVETDRFSKEAGHRPSKLFRFNPKWRKE